MSAHPDARNSMVPPRKWLTKKGPTWWKKKREKKRGQEVVMEGEARMSNDEGGDMIRLSQGISECHVDEEMSRAAGLSELGENIVRHGNSGHAMDVSLGTKCVATMADVSGHSQTSSSGGMSQRRHEQELQRHAVELPVPGSLSCNPAITAVSSSSLSFSNHDDNSTIISSVITAGNDKYNGGGNSGTMMTRMVECKQLGGTCNRFVPFGALSNSSFEPSTDTLSSGGISCLVGGGDVSKDKYGSCNVIVPEILATISSEALTRRGDCAGSVGGGGGDGGGGGGSFADNQPGQLGSSQPPAKFAGNTGMKPAKKAKKENKTANIFCSDMAGMRKRQQVTLTQGDFLEERAKKKMISTYQHCRKHDGKSESAQIKKRGSLNEMITYSKGEVWESDDKMYEGCAFTLGDIRAYNLEYEAEIQEMWMKLNHTFIGPKQASSVKENLGCWVLLEKHEKMPNNGRIKVKTLRNKLAADVRKPTTHYTEDGLSSFSYFKKFGDQTTPTQNTDLASPQRLSRNGVRRRK